MILIVGADGQLGSDIADEFRHHGDVTPLTHAHVSVEDEASVMRCAHLKPKVIINTAAYHSLPKCEEHPRHAMDVNALGCLNLVKLADKCRAYLVHVSTDYVFGGTKGSPYKESDLPRPLNMYGVSKLAGEQIVLQFPSVAVLRVAAVYGSRPCRAKGGPNFVERVLSMHAAGERMKMPDYETTTPTYTRDIARQIARLVDERVMGVFHGTAHGSATWYEFARAVLTEIGTEIGDVSARADASPFLRRKTPPRSSRAEVQRPLYSVLDNERLRGLELDTMTDWRDGLRRYLRETGRAR